MNRLGEDRFERIREKTLREWSRLGSKRDQAWWSGAGEASPKTQGENQCRWGKRNLRSAEFCDVDKRAKRQRVVMARCRGWPRKKAED